METARERCIYGTLLLHHLPKLGDGQEKIPGQIRFLPELDCISLEGESQIRFRGHKFSLHHRTEVFSGWMRGARKSVLVKGEVDKENGAAGEGQVHSWSTLVFYFLYF